MHPIAVWCATALALVGHGFVWTGAVNRLHGLKGPRRVIKALTWLCIALFVALPLAIAWAWIAVAGRPNPFEADDWTRVYVWICAAIGAASLIVKPWIERLRYDGRALTSWTSDVRDVAKTIGCRPLAGPVAKALDLIPGNEALALSIDRKRLVIPRLPVELAGLTIAHISDLHLTGRVGREYFEYAARVVNDLRPDVIAITGDIVEDERCWPWLEDSVGRLCAPLGVYFVLGNHDEFIDATRTRDLLVDFGLTCLSGRWLRAEWNGAPVALAGNELPWMPAAPLREGHSRTDDDREFRLALCHTPDQFGWCVRAGIDLALAGHTHGGQVQVPVLGVIGSPSLHGTRYACGVFRRGTTVLHVTRGIGGETPWRWHCPPEIALLELTNAASGAP
jgi:predicted MPP superfamily phosphohydrolase